MGCKKAPPVTLTALASPPAIFAGEPVTVTATPGALSTKKKTSVIYNWSGTGVTGTGTTATVATTTLAPGSYTVKAEVKEGKLGKEGLKPGQSAEATASFTVKQFEPPTISCSVSPSTIKPGESSTITAVGVSPQNRPLTYSYAASAGSIQGNGATATFSSIGAPTGPVSITCTVTDDKGQSASTTISAANTVTIMAPYVAPVPHTQALASINYGKDKKRPARADNEAKAILDEIALDLQRQPDAKLVVVGEANAKEQAKTAKEKKAALKHKHLKVEDIAAERAVNVKDYLVTEKGIDASRISVATGTADDQKVENYLVPAGANFAADVQGTTPVDETAVKAQPRKALTKAAHKKAAAKPAAAK
jgi:outer membrane protein OmpA-like peptidoglycan-associated protein